MSITLFSNESPEEWQKKLEQANASKPSEIDWSLIVGKVKIEGDPVEIIRKMRDEDR
jgi:hypothetical protein